MAKRMPSSSRTAEFGFELRTASDGSTGTGRRLEGIAAVFNTDTHIRSHEGDFLERITRGAFAKSIRDNPHPLMQWDHGRDSRVGTTPIGAYDTLREDPEGLFVSGELFDNPVVEPVRQAIEAGAVRGMSISMQVIRDEWRDAKGRPVGSNELRRLLWADPDDPAYRGLLPLRRTIKELRLGEAGPVGRPAYTTTSVGVRSTEPRTLTIKAAKRQLALINFTRRT